MQVSNKCNFLANATKLRKSASWESEAATQDVDLNRHATDSENVSSMSDGQAGLLTGALNRFGQSAGNVNRVRTGSLGLGSGTMMIKRAFEL